MVEKSLEKSLIKYIDAINFSLWDSGFEIGNAVL
jgi:hypothetical protein